MSRSQAECLKQFQGTYQEVTHLQRDMHARVNMCRDYPSWPLKQRVEFLEQLDSTVSLATNRCGFPSALYWVAQVRAFRPGGRGVGKVLQCECHKSPYLVA